MLGKSLTLCWSWKFTPELAEGFLEPHRELNSNLEYLWRAPRCAREETLT